MIEKETLPSRRERRYGILKDHRRQRAAGELRPSMRRLAAGCQGEGVGYTERGIGWAKPCTLGSEVRRHVG